MLIDPIKQDAAYNTLNGMSSCPFENIKLCGTTASHLTIMESMFDSA